MLSLKMNDAAVQTLGVLTGLERLEPPGGLATGLQEKAARGIIRHGQALTWSDSHNPANAQLYLDDLNRWECDDSSFHLEDFVPVKVATVDNAPVIAEQEQRTLLLHGLAFALEFAELIYALQTPTPVRCVISAGDTNATFRFHQIRPDPGRYTDLDAFQQEKMITVDIEPFRVRDSEDRAQSSCGEG
ncbi:hypothetical protein [Actinomadura rupiterrae]|uniref:hypothetical protein n=1 Tax=Actinomadura rupiterrae TaxID=559627 RepID=UPI0020A6137E|nr:hypothetical protein [Actinomadura rupiterrae]MCP2336147.1 hypothetical protein [Actinomadura rupiterrae]